MFIRSQFHFLLTLLSLFPSSSLSTCNHLDQKGLLSLSTHLSSPHSNPLNWSSSTDCCNWEGITCNSGPRRRVTGINLPSRGLKGHLTSLNFSSSLTHLITFNLTFNLLSGQFPSSPFPPSIKTLDLSSNNFSGTIKSSFFHNTFNKGEFFSIANNSFSGSFPFSSVCVRFLDISNNHFNGEISNNSFTGCLKIEVFRAGFNSFSGLFPNSVYNLRNLSVLELYENQFTGNLSDKIGNLEKLEKLIIFSNNLTGLLPPSLMNCVNLVEINLRNNKLEGDISSLNFSKLKKLRLLDLDANEFTGMFPESLQLCESLVAIRLPQNHINGEISSGMVKLQSLAHLSVSINNLTNLNLAITTLMGCKNLSVVILSLNFFDEEMPDGEEFMNLDGFENLQLLSIGSCGLKGKIPGWLMNMKKLKVLDLSYNRLTGPIPLWLGSMPRLSHVVFTGNLLSGEIPMEITRIPSLISQQSDVLTSDLANLDLPVFTGPNYLQYNRLFNLRPAIFLNDNNLSGRIPVGIGQLRLLHILNLSQNKLLGTIPDELSNIKSLESLDLSRNRLSGEIPMSLGSLYFLSSFSVAYNLLRGRIPTMTQFQTFPVSSFEGNPGLCGTPLTNECLIQNRNNVEESEEADSLVGDDFYVSMGIGYFTGLLIVCATLVFHTTWRRAYFRFLINLFKKFFNKYL
ncbi:receptor-like protein 2 [Impatiens glandulifera]|uniref:receptor-like protein 2 n=1 Tax=Impatiens glandulifera TaxID=253017 RepID=UPI001FB1733D|nr:receptor-like protein 2 [Impatiens glandulifera]